VLFGETGQDKLVWCNYDTVGPLTTNGVLLDNSGVLTLPPWCVTFIDQVENQLRSLPHPDYVFGYPFSAAIRKPGEPRPAFLAISYAPVFDAAKACVLQAANDTGFHCEVTGDLGSPGNVMDQVWQGIRGADVVVADITGANPNVMIEVGLAAALGKEVIVISRDAGLPFDIRHWRTITYAAGQLPELARELSKAFGSVSARYPFEGNEPRF